MINPTLYEALPYAYIGAGAINAVLLDSPLKYLPAFLLIGAGLLILAWRRSARARTRRIAHAVRRARDPFASQL
jgi:membrane protein implicated in regulation of membrane protease activity